MVNKTFISIYNKFVNCKNKDMVLLKITRYIKDMIKYLKSADMYDEIPKSTIENLIINLIIYGLIFNNRSDIQELLLDLFYKEYTHTLEPELEMLLIYITEETVKNIKTLNPVLNNAALLLPIDVIKYEKETYLKIVLCINNKGETNVIRDR